MASNGDDLGTMLGIWAHPDDETWLAAGLMVRAVGHGRRVVCVTATRGEAGFPDDDVRTTAERSAIREAELAQSLATLGVTEHRWLGYADGGCAAIDDEQAVAQVVAIIDEVRPDTLLTFGPDGGTGHGDHVSVCRWTTMALDRLAGPRPRLLYSTKLREWMETFTVGWDPSTVMMIEGFRPEMVEEADLAVRLVCSDAELDSKVAALRAQASQIEPLVQAVGVDAFRNWNRDEFFRDPIASDPDTLAFATAYSRGQR